MEIERLMVRLVADASQYMRVFDVAETRLISYAAGVSGLIATMSAKLAAEYERAAIAFEVMTGSASVGKKMLDDITKMAIETPFHSNELIAAGKQLESFGFSAHEIIPTLHALGEASAATNTPINRIVLAFGQVRTAGRLLGQELRQFTNAGIPMAEMLAEVTGKPVESIRKMVREGNVGFHEVSLAFNLLTQSGGRYHGMMERINKETVSGRWEAFTENLQVAARNFGMAAFEGMGLREVLSTMKDWTDGLQGNRDNVVEFFRRVREVIEEIWDLLKPIREWINRNEELFVSTLKVIGILLLLGGVARTLSLVLRLTMFTGAGLFGIVRTLGLLAAAFVVLVPFMDPAKEGFRDLSKWIDQTVMSVSTWISNNERLIGQIAAVAAGVGLLVAAVRIANITFLALRAAWFAGWAAMVSPIGVAVLALSGLVAVLYSIDAFTDLGGGMLRGFRELSATVSQTIEGVKDAVAGGRLDLAFDVIFQAIKYGWKVVIATLQAEWEQFAANFDPQGAVMRKLATWAVEAEAKIKRVLYEVDLGFISGIDLRKVEQDRQRGLAAIEAEFNANRERIAQATQGKINDIFAQLGPAKMELELSIDKAKIAKEVKEATTLWEELIKKYQLVEETRSVVAAHAAVAGGFGMAGIVAPHTTAEGKIIPPSFLATDKMRTAVAELQSRFPYSILPSVPFAGPEAAGKAAPPMLPAFSITPQARTLADKLMLEMEKGVGPYDFFRTRMGLYREAFEGPKQIQGMAGVIPFGVIDPKTGRPYGQVLNEEQKRYGYVKAFEDLQKMVGKEDKDRLPPLAMQGTREAQEIINRNQGQMLDVDQEILKTLREAKAIQEEQAEYQRRVADMLERLGPQFFDPMF